MKQHKKASECKRVLHAHMMLHRRFREQMKGGRKRFQSRLNSGTSLFWTALTSRGHAAVTRGRAQVKGGRRSILRRVLGRGGERMRMVVGGGAAEHEALWCHHNVSLCQVQSSLAVIF